MEAALEHRETLENRALGPLLTRHAGRRIAKSFV